MGDDATTMMSAVDQPRRFRSRQEVEAIQYTGLNRPAVIDYCEAWIDNDKDRLLVRIRDGANNAVLPVFPGDWVVVFDGQAVQVHKADEFRDAFEPQ